MREEGLSDYFESEGLLEDGRISGLGRDDIVRAMDHFGVSRQALVYRLRNSKLMPAETTDRLLEDRFSVSAMARALGIELRVPEEIGGQLNGLAVEAWRRGLISTGRAAELFGLDLQSFRERMEEIGVGQELEEEVPLLGAAAEV
jgi:hypothetical protein